MQATSLSINLAGGCNAKCPFCIAEAVWDGGTTENMALRRGLSRALNYARYHGVDTVLITGSGEPTIHRDLLLRILAEVRRVQIPVTELQTNGALLAKKPDYLDELFECGINTIAISVGATDPAESSRLMAVDFDYLELVRAIRDRGMLCRISINLCQHDQDLLNGGLPIYATCLFDAGASQLTLRKLGVPDAPLENDESKRKMQWVRENAMPHDDIMRLHTLVREGGTLLRRLSYGADVYDYHNLSVCVASCMTENQNPDEIRSLILMPDGHVYHSWNYRGSVLV